MAHFNVYRSRGGYGFEVTYPDGRLRGWRPTRRWAKAAAQSEVLDALDIDPDVKPTFAAPQTKERHLRPSPPKRNSRRSKQLRRRALLISAAVVALAVIVAGVAVFVRSRPKSAVSNVPGTLAIYANPRIKPALDPIINDFKLRSPATTVVVTYGTSASFQDRAKKADLGDIYIDAPTSLDWMSATVPPDGTESLLGFDVLEMVVRAGNPKKITDLTVFSEGKNPPRLGLCLALQPCGSAGRSALRAAKVQQPANATVADAKANIDKVASGLVDVALVFRTDFALHPAPGLTKVDLDKGTAIRFDYQIRKGRRTAPGQTFMDYVHSADGANTLHRFGLLAD